MYCKSLFNKRDAAWNLLSAALVGSLIYNAVFLLGDITDRSEVCDSSASSTAHVSNSSFPLRMALKLPTRYAPSAAKSTRKQRTIGSKPDDPWKPESAYGKYALFILYSWNHAMFRSSLQSYIAAGLGPHTIVIDNSLDRRIARDSVVVELVAEVIPTRTKLTFSQLQNYIADISIERNYEYYFWGHSDVAVMATIDNRTFAEEVLGCMDKVMATQPLWGLLRFGRELADGTGRDWFLATRTDMARSVLYDTFITVYKSDCDYFARVQHQGWLVSDFVDFCGELPIKTYDLKRPLNLPIHNRKWMEEVLEADRQEPLHRNDWKNKEMAAGEEVGWSLWEEASTKYFRKKWNLTDSEFSGGVCVSLSVPNPATGKEEPRRPWSV